MLVLLVKGSCLSHNNKSENRERCCFLLLSFYIFTTSIFGKIERRGGRDGEKERGVKEERREGKEKGEIAHFLDHVQNASGYFKTFDIINH